MFSKYRKPDSAQPAAKPEAVARTPAKPEAAPKPTSMRRPVVKALAARPVASDKEQKRKERMGELKLELHRALLDNLNLSALEHATEADLKSEISDIGQELLNEKGVVLNRDDRSTLIQELYDEVKGLGPLEPLLQDDNVNDILVNGRSRSLSNAPASSSSPM